MLADYEDTNTLMRLDFIINLFLCFSRRILGYYKVVHLNIYNQLQISAIYSYRNHVISSSIFMLEIIIKYYLIILVLVDDGLQEIFKYLQVGEALDVMTCRFGEVNSMGNMDPKWIYIAHARRYEVRKIMLCGKSME